MLWLSNSTIVRLRDQLKARGQRPSLVGAAAGDADLSADAALELAMLAEYGPLCESMYLMMSADGTVGDAERDVLKGALRNLAGDAIRSSHIDTMLAVAEKRVTEEGRESRFQAVVGALHGDKARAEVAFVLAAAIAFADNAIADEENETLNDLAEGLGIDEGRANELLDDVEKDLAAQTTAKE
ncbi:MAG: hypothetical protein JWP97_4497 [Labilithrix sp.]|nr:hypothetical protein [Labilithrix sp.]